MHILLAYPSLDMLLNATLIKQQHVFAYFQLNMKNSLFVCYISIDLIDIFPEPTSRFEVHMRNISCRVIGYRTRAILKGKKLFDPLAD